MQPRKQQEEDFHGNMVVGLVLVAVGFCGTLLPMLTFEPRVLAWYEYAFPLWLVSGILLLVLTVAFDCLGHALHLWRD